MAAFFAVFLTLYAAINYYIFIRGWQAISSIHILKPFYIIVFLLFAASFIIAKFLESYLPQQLYDFFLRIGSFWFAFMLYFFLAIVFLDLVRLINYFIPFFPQTITNNYVVAKEITALAVFLISLIIIIAGYVNTRTISINNLTIDLPKKSSSLTELNAVVLSDIHISPINDGNLLNKIVKKINSLNPDVVLIVGDVVDDRSDILNRDNIGDEFRNIKSKYGTFACTGNHEFINGINNTEKFINDHGIKLLRDESENIDNGFVLICRDDRAKKQFTGKDRKKLSDLVKTIDKSLPVILMDHTPFGLEEAEQNQIDFQLSGHTHYGQMFPLGYITNLVYEKSWGYIRKGNTQYYVSCGVGTWGPPVRTGSPSEIINLKIKFVD